MHPKFSSVTMDDLLVSPNTVALIASLQLHGALQHVRAFGAKVNQRVRGRAVLTRDQTTFVQVELEDGDHTVTKTLLLVEEFWARLAACENGGGGVIAGQMDAQAAIGEIETRLRNDPTLGDIRWMAASTRGTLAAPQAPQAPRPPALPTTHSSPATHHRHGEPLGKPAATPAMPSGDEPKDGGAAGRASGEKGEEAGGHPQEEENGIPLEIFKEHPLPDATPAHEAVQAEGRHDQSA